MKKNQHSYLFRFVCRFVRLFLLTLFGLAIAYVMSFGFGVLDFAVVLLPIVFDWIWRLGVILLCLIATTMVVESLY